MYYRCKLCGGCWRIITTVGWFHSFHKNVIQQYRYITNCTGDSSLKRSVYDPHSLYDMSNKNFQAKRFQLVSITRMLDNYLCWAFFLDSWHIFSLIMKLFTKQSPQILKILVISGFLFSFIYLEGRWSQSVSAKCRQLQFTYCISIKHDFLELVDMTHSS